MQDISIGFYDEKHLIGSFIFDVFTRKKGIRVYFNARYESSLLEELTNSVPDVLLLNLTPKINFNFSFIKKIKNDFPALNMVGFVYGIELTQQKVFLLINAGIASILTDAHSPDEIFLAVKSVAEKGFHMNDVVNEAMMTYCKRSRLLRNTFGPETKFSERETIIIREKRFGKTSQQIADQLYVSKKTIDGILQDMYGRFECKNFNELSTRYDFSGGS